MSMSNYLLVWYKNITIVTSGQKTVRSHGFQHGQQIHLQTPNKIQFLLYSFVYQINNTSRKLCPLNKKDKCSPVLGIRCIRAVADPVSRQSADA